MIFGYFSIEERLLLPLEYKGTEFNSTELKYLVFFCCYLIALSGRLGKWLT